MVGYLIGQAFDGLFWLVVFYVMARLFIPAKVAEHFATVAGKNVVDK